LFSGLVITNSFFRDLEVLLKLDESQFKLLLSTIVRDTKEEVDDESWNRMAAQFGVSPSELSDSILPVMNAITARMLAGTTGPEIEEDLATQGNFPLEKIKFLFSSVEHLSSGEKASLRYSSLDAQIRDLHPHWRSIFTDSQLRSAEDNGHLLGMIPYFVLQIQAEGPDSVRNNWYLELRPDELDRLIKSLKSIREEIYKVVQEFKSRQAGMVVIPEGW